jgi:uncharacterized membrane protein
MNTTTLGIFRSKDHAEDAINALNHSGISSKDISIIIKDDAIVEEITKNTGGKIVGGATTGSIVGGIAGLLIGIGSIIIPGIGGLLIAGPIALGLTGAAATTVSGVLTGALAGGLLGGLIGLGLPESEAEIYEKNIQAGSILLGVPTDGLTESNVRNILEKYHGQHVKTINKK